VTAGKRARGLTGQDRALWSEVTKSVAPLRPGRGVATEDPDEPIENAKEISRPARPRPRPQPLEPPRPASLAAIDRRTKQRLSRGRVSVDARLDLHGMTQAAAHARLESFLRSAQANGHTHALVITGKGRANRADDFDEERGVLRRQVPLWLALPEMRPYVVGFSEAGPRHGGAGALYVRIRRPR
jgi:DNA-nicking Smr family endonuclease